VIINDLVGGKSKIVTTPAVEDDPQRRKPDITRAMTYLNWKPKVYYTYILYTCKCRVKLSKVIQTVQELLI